MINSGKLVGGAVVVTALVLLGGCTEEARNKISRTTDNFLGEDLRVSYIDNGQVVKTWTVKDSKITSGKDEAGNATPAVQMQIEDLKLRGVRFVVCAHSLERRDIRSTARLFDVTGDGE